jgi:acyl carrier protein
MTENCEKLVSAFSSALGIENERINDDLRYQELPEWDSVSHMIIISEIEAAFNVSIDTDDVIDMSSFAKAKEILKKYNITF